jgi:hypothetical protein
MDDIQEKLQPLIDLLPENVRPYWWAVFGLAGLLLILVFLGLAGWLVRRLFGKGKAASEDWAKKLREDLSTYPLPPEAEGKERLTIYHVPVRIRLVVLAAAGKETEIDPAQAESLLNRVIPGLGAIAKQDRPRVRIWPPQLSQQGFATGLFRHTVAPQKEGQPSPWVLVAGRSQFNQPALLLGLAFWAKEPNNVGRVSLEPHQWLDVLRIKETNR